MRKRQCWFSCWGKNMEEKKRYLVLEDGQIFEGLGFGAENSALGELVFTTGMVGYVETLTDPSYYGQIVMHTFPLIGNYGMITKDMENSGTAIKGYVVREWCKEPSNFRSEGDIDAYLKKQGVPGIYGLDTRELTQIIREKGVMNAWITDDPSAVSKEQLQAYKPTGAVAHASVKSKADYPVAGSKYHVALLDYGAKYNIIQELNAKGCGVTVFPHDTAAEEILAANPNGVMLSNGPGDPADNPFQIEQIQKLLGKLPLFGICLGHQLLALACGGKTVKLKHGHRGANQPVKRLKDGRTFISFQNHGYAVVNDSVTANGGIISYINANDGTCEGAEYPKQNAFSVQFHPEACGGPKDAEALFEQFISLMGGETLCR